MVTACRCGVESFGLTGCYWCLKQRVDWNHRPPEPNGLSEAERAFIGLAIRPRRRNGWRAADGLIRALDPEGDADLERFRGLRYVMQIGGMREELSV